ncbi:MAG: alpha-amylase family glycosyl hydrolase [Clostridia bacterium]|nr:alpha-amylase family glycosyl hydrolase [Clostridia bacterium]
MAVNTSISLRNKIIYCVYTRNYKGNGTFRDVESDLDRIRDLGVDIVWFLPVHPIGQVNRKGNLGSPYSIEDHREINPEYGTIEDFKKLLDGIHSKGMMVMMDIPFYYTSYKSKLYKAHPEWFYRKPDGSLGSKIDHCDDVIEPDYSNRELWDYQIETLKYWAEFGIDGFRCDLAQLVPLEFWQKAREEVEKVKKGIIWLSDSISPDFMMYMRNNGFSASSDCEMFQVFDITYDYDVDFAFRPFLRGESSLDSYIERLRCQEIINPSNYVKLRFLENHDQERAKMLFPVKEDLIMWTAFLYFQKGAVLLYAGQEAMDEKTPNLFDKDRVNWNGMTGEFSSYIKLLGAIKKDPLFASGRYMINDTSKRGVVAASYKGDTKKLIGVFNIERKEGFIEVDCRDGIYKNMIDGEDLAINQGKLRLNTKPVIFEVKI